MRADRLLALLMLLQSRGRMTARDLARELEVSERTIYRDIDALSIAGVPVYGEPGPEGGYALVDRYRTNLTGLTEGEVRALFMLSIPAPLADLGVTQELRMALRKLSAALPDVHRNEETRARQRFHLDSTWWEQDQESVPHLRTIHKAVWEDRKLRLKYRPLFAVEIERCVAPYGLVAKAGIWHLVYARSDRVRAHRVSDFFNVEILPEHFKRPTDFDLAKFWSAWCAEQERFLSSYTATVRVAPDFLPELSNYFDLQTQTRIAEAGPPDADGWVTLALAFKSFEMARARILSFGRGVEVLEPRALRRSVLDHAEQIIALYAQRE